MGRNPLEAALAAPESAVPLTGVPCVYVEAAEIIMDLEIPRKAEPVKTNSWFAPRL